MTDTTMQVHVARSLARDAETWRYVQWLAARKALNLGREVVDYVGMYVDPATGNEIHTFLTRELP